MHTYWSIAAPPAYHQYSNLGESEVSNRSPTPTNQRALIVPQILYLINSGNNGDILQTMERSIAQ